ncbi:hypothetical protein BH20VER3_BH20VER3_02200 [soil metagenome]
MQITTPPEPQHHPGPFGPAKVLLPPNQQLSSISESESISVALRKMLDGGFSQLPVIDQSNRVIGIFSFRSLGKYMFVLEGSELKTKAPKITTLSVANCMEPAVYISPDEYIDTASAADFRNIDYVLVGSPERLIGILSVADVFARLNDFAEAFVLLFEMELSLRKIIAHKFAEELQDALERLNRDSKSSGFKQGYVRRIEDCQFSQYQALIVDGENWSKFEPVFSPSPRDLLKFEIQRANALRNDVFHFKRQITRADTIVLRAFRDKINAAVARLPQSGPLNTAKAD